MTLPPRVLDNLDYFSKILSADRVGLFSDFDGTLTPIFDDPRDTVLSSAMRDTLSELSRKLELVAVVSGRDLKTLREMVGLSSVTYVGNHGLEVWKAGAERQEYEEQISDGLLGDVEKGVQEIGISGLSLEDKGMSVAVHYRNAPDPTAVRSVLLQMLKSLAVERGLETREGKMVLEIGPMTSVNKGTAVVRLAREFELTGAIFLGDDVTDCDAFDALHELARERDLKGAAVAVVDRETPDAVLRKADYCLSGTEDVEQFLRWMAYASPRAATKL
jgi:trehalose 6-phosphate phosphatase